MYQLSLNQRAYDAIKAGTKTIEVRANKGIHYNPGEVIIFNGDLICEIVSVKLYNSVRDLLVDKGTTSVLSSGKDLEDGIISIESIGNYKEIIAKNGVFAIELVKKN